VGQAMYQNSDDGSAAADDEDVVEGEYKTE